MGKTHICIYLCMYQIFSSIFFMNFLAFLLCMMMTRIISLPQMMGMTYNWSILSNQKISLMKSSFISHFLPSFTEWFVYIIHKKMDKNTTLLAKMSYYCFKKTQVIFFKSWYHFWCWWSWQVQVYVQMAVLREFFWNWKICMWLWASLMAQQ